MWCLHNVLEKRIKADISRVCVVTEVIFLSHMSIGKTKEIFTCDPQEPHFAYQSDPHVCILYTFTVDREHTYKLYIHFLGVKSIDELAQNATLFTFDKVEEVCAPVTTRTMFKRTCRMFTSLLITNGGKCDVYGFRNYWPHNGGHYHIDVHNAGLPLGPSMCLFIGGQRVYP